MAVLELCCVFNYTVNHFKAIWWKAAYILYLKYVIGCVEMFGLCYSNCESERIVVVLTWQVMLFIKLLLARRKLSDVQFFLFWKLVEHCISVPSNLPSDFGAQGKRVHPVSRWLTVIGPFGNLAEELSRTSVILVADAGDSSQPETFHHYSITKNFPVWFQTLFFWQCCLLLAQEGRDIVFGYFLSSALAHAPQKGKICSWELGDSQEQDGM